jgi:cytochrome c oxidase assembly factor CtaG
MSPLSKFFLNIGYLFNDKLSEDFYHRISSIILVFAAILTYNRIFAIESLSGIGIFTGLFTVTSISQVLEKERL